MKKWRLFTQKATEKRVPYVLEFSQMWPSYDVCEMLVCKLKGHLHQQNNIMLIPYRQQKPICDYREADNKVVILQKAIERIFVLSWRVVRGDLIGLGHL